MSSRLSSYLRRQALMSRRGFLAGSSAAALLTALPGFMAQAIADTRPIRHFMLRPDKASAQLVPGNYPATSELSALSRDHGLSEEFQGCHLALIDGYFVSGHVPVTVIDKMLSERPDIDGITLPGMPLGSPGMGGKKNEPWKIFAIDDGNPTVFATQ